MDEKKEINLYYAKNCEHNYIEDYIDKKLYWTKPIEFKIEP